ncbi:MAG: hypothetical protein NTX79_08160 [Candidatus Micrarchaeota archaeon]|nr:hypothetical protein [Candidatus Micrarchaeota archaeon]
MASSKQAGIGIRFFVFLSFALLSLFTASAHATSGVCGQFYSGSGTCTTTSPSGTQSVICSSDGLQDPDCCTSVQGCEWKTPYTGDDGYCDAQGGSSFVDCSDYNNNQEACDAVGCTFTQNSGVGGCTGSASGSGYGMPCGSGCATCLVCDTTVNPSRCTQKPGVCTTLPAEYVAPPPSDQQAGTGLTPQSAIGNLQSGTTGGTGGAVVGSSSSIYKVGWFSDWKVMGLIGVAIVCSIIALAAMIGIAFNMPEVRAFANTEIKQAVISVLLIVSLIALVTFFDTIAALSISSADLPVACNTAEPCYITAAKAYLGQIYDTGSEYAKNQLSESIVNAKRASYGYNLNLNKIYLLFAGMSIRFNAGDSLVAERHGALFTQASKLISSVYSQKYFIDVITFGVAPLFILLGIVLRTFFFTRKLGGLLLAIAISLFIVYPLTYAFAWYTLNVTVYGERTLSVADPNCPGECTGTYPVAFFTDSSGDLVQFPTIQSIMRAGINKTNWQSGGPAGAFPGLVACRDLSAINLPTGVAPNSCPDCPDYCRDVPFPSGIPGCNITKCSACNAGCKIVRQRLTCQTDPSCAGKCPLNCRTRVPLENKCFSNETGGIMPASLGVSCSGCGKYPAWCRFLKNESGVLTPVYNDPAKDKACTDPATGKDISNDPACPQQCSYITSMGTDATCDSLCSDPATNTVCPKECRVGELLNDPSWAGTYDLDPPNLTRSCSETPGIDAACKTCAKHPECLVTAAHITGCSKYPTVTHTSQLCLDCPDYCRRDNFNNFFTSLSNVERNSSNFPNACLPAFAPGINCSTSGTPPACNSSCRMASFPTICRPYQKPPAANTSLCGACPDSTRFTVRYTKNGTNCSGGQPQGSGGLSPPPTGGYTILFSSTGASGSTIRLAEGGNDQNGQGEAPCTVTFANLSLKSQYDCSTAACPSYCQDPVVVNLPNESFDPACKDAILTGCPYGCRVKGVGSGFLDTNACSGCTSLRANHPDCFVDPTTPPPAPWPICSEYIGNGPASCHSGDCVILNQTTCASQGTGCTWTTGSLCDKAACTAIHAEAACTAATGCSWTATARYVPINERAGQYDNREDCRQCPEQCRLKGYTGNCGVLGNGADQYVDCSESACPTSCRMAEPSPSSTPPKAECHPYPEDNSTACLNCPALCRRQSDIAISSCSLYSDCAVGDTPTSCIGDCLLDNPPKKACEGCLDCDYDCIYYPSIRTDCSDICSDEALAGPVNIEPNDFIKSLPGAKTAYVETKDIGVLYLPAVVLPLFCIVIVIAFIRILSPLLGGDIEIPGLGRII